MVRGMGFLLSLFFSNFFLAVNTVGIAFLRYLEVSNESTRSFIIGKEYQNVLLTDLNL